MKRLQLALRWKIMLTILLISVAVVAFGAVQSYYAPASSNPLQTPGRLYRRFDEYRKSIGNAMSTSAAFIAADPELVTGLTESDPTRIRASFGRAITALEATSKPDLIVLLDRGARPIAMDGTTRIAPGDAAASRLFTDVRGGLALESELAKIGDRIFQVSASPVRAADGAVVGGVILGFAFDDFVRDYQRQSARISSSPTKIAHFVAVDARGDVIVSTLPGETGGALAGALVENRWKDVEERTDEGRQTGKAIEIDDVQYNFTREQIQGYDGPRQRDLGAVFVLRRRLADAELQTQFEDQLIPLLIVGAIALFVGFLLSVVVTRPLHRYIKATSDLASGHGDLTRRLDESSGDELGKLAHNLNAVFAHIHDLAAKVQRAAFQVGASSAEISAASKQMLDGAQEQARKTESSTAAITELSASIQQVAENAMEATRVARSSGAAVEGAIERMNEIRGTVEEAAQRIQELGESGKRIGNIVEVIRQISDQTTLLALNAAIEAAHAGEQGRGFAVVADEVSQLATRVGQSARDIEDLIATIKEQTVEAVRAMSTGTREVEEGTKLVTATLADLRKLVTVVEDTAKAVQEQAVASDEIARNMDVVQRIAQDVLSSSEEAVTQGDHLHRLAHQLEESVKGFRIDPGAVSGGDGSGGAATKAPAQLPPATGTGEARR